MPFQKRNTTLAFLLPIQISVVQYLSHYQNVIEVYYANGVYPYLSKVLRLLFGWVPFSVGDVLVILFLFLSLRFLLLSFKYPLKKQRNRVISAIAVLSIVHFCFYLFWGLNYFRKPLETQFDFKTSEYTTEALLSTTTAIVNQANAYHQKLVANDTLIVEFPISKSGMYSIAVDGYKSLSETYPNFKYSMKSVKHSGLSIFQSYNGTSGYLNPLTGEAQVNNKIPKTGYPTTVCHEMAHQIGFAAENEANFIGFLAANYNNNPYFKYSSYRMALAYCLNELRKRNPQKHKEIISTIHKGILKDYNNSYQFWQQYKNPLEPLLKKGYNAYLKANNQEKGIDSYNYVVDLLISYHQFNGEI